LARSKAIVNLQGVEKTRRFGEIIGQLSHGGEVLALIGELGAGKTTFSQGLAYGLGISKDNPVTSPTFVLIIHHTTGRLELYHVDLYRLDADEASEIGLDDFFGEPGTISIVEWADRAIDLLPDDRLEINMHWTGLEERRAELTACGKLSEKLLNDFLSEWSE
jgi:tRNA threonylcarbamoyladenosine biosynthesis protein TsaE